MKNKLKYLLLLFPLFLIVFIIFKKPQTLPSKGESQKMLPSPEVVKMEETKRKISSKEFKRKIIYLTPSSSKTTKFINKQNDNWINLLEDNLLKFQEPTTKIKIVHLESLILAKYGKARLVEKVLVSFISHNEPVSSFNAYIDSQTGEIVGMPWNKTVVENKNYPKLRPTGVIKKPKKDKDSN